MCCVAKHQTAPRLFRHPCCGAGTYHSCQNELEADTEVNAAAEFDSANRTVPPRQRSCDGRRVCVRCAGRPSGRRNHYCQFTMGRLAGRRTPHKSCGCSSAGSRTASGPLTPSIRWAAWQRLPGTEERPSALSPGRRCRPDVFRRCGTVARVPLPRRDDRPRRPSQNAHGCFQRAAEHGSVTALFNLGASYQFGTTPDGCDGIEKAKRLYRRAAALRHALARSNFAQLLCSPSHGGTVAPATMRKGMREHRRRGVGGPPGPVRSRMRSHQHGRLRSIPRL